MAKLFWLLVAAAQSGYRYLRAILEAGTVYLKAKATTAPGSDMEAELKVENPKIKAEGASHPVADGNFQGALLSVKMLAVMIAKLISDVVFRGRAGEVPMGADIGVPPAADGAGNFRAVTPTTAQAGAPPAADGKGVFRAISPLTAQAEAPPGNPVDFKAKVANGLTAKPRTAPPVPMGAELVAERIDLEATATDGTPKPFEADAGPLAANLYATTVPGTPAEIQANRTTDMTRMLASVHTWRGPVRDGTNLYIPQVHSYQRDSNSIKIS